jgi:hypothetical protein
LRGGTLERFGYRPGTNGVNVAAIWMGKRL